jgi:RimJ/RimL family protein N-acetyltransferase
MKLTVREMKLEEAGIIADYFHEATPEYLEMLGVDPTKVPEREKLLQRYAHECSLPRESRKQFIVVWILGDTPVGFSSADRIVFGREAYMHLHIFRPEHRKSGYGAECVKETVKIYFEQLDLQRVFCEPNAFNVAPNRTLQRAGFTYLKTHMTVPGPLNYHQAVTRWVLEKSNSHG